MRNCCYLDELLEYELDDRGEAIPGKEDLMNDLPQRIQEEVSMKRCGTLLSNVRFFNDLYPAELRKLSTIVYIYRFAPGDIVMYSRDMGRELYCVRKGHVEVKYLEIFFML